METSESTESLKKKVQTLAPIIAGFRQALEKLSLSDEERQVISGLLGTHGAEYEGARHLLKKIGRESASSRPKRTKRTKPKSLSQVDLVYQEKRDQNIEKSHKISGFKRIRIHFVQGGSPGLGKSS